MRYSLSRWAGLTSFEMSSRLVETESLCLYSLGFQSQGYHVRHKCSSCLGISPLAPRVMANVAKQNKCSSQREPHRGNISSAPGMATRNTEEINIFPCSYTQVSEELLRDTTTQLAIALTGSRNSYNACSQSMGIRKHVDLGKHHWC